MHFRLYVTGTMMVNVGCLFDWTGEPLRDISVGEYVRLFQEGLTEGEDPTAEWVGPSTRALDTKRSMGKAKLFLPAGLPPLLCVRHPCCYYCRHHPYCSSIQ